MALTYLLIEPHICVSELGQHWFRYWLVFCLAPSHHLNQHWRIINWTLRNKLQWNLNQNKKPFSTMKLHLKMSSVKWLPNLCRGMSSPVGDWIFYCDPYMVGLYFFVDWEAQFLGTAQYLQEGKCTLSWRWDRLVTNLSGHIFVPLIAFAYLKLTFPVKKDQQKCRLLPRCLLNFKATRSCFLRNS